MNPWRMEGWLHNTPGGDEREFPFPATTDEDQPTLSTPASEATPSMIAGEPASPTQAGRRASSADEVEFAASHDATVDYNEKSSTRWNPKEPLPAVEAQKPVPSLDIDGLTLLGAADEHSLPLDIDEPAPCALEPGRLSESQSRDLKVEGGGREIRAQVGGRCEGLRGGDA